jgi:hypothetical protein
MTEAEIKATAQLLKKLEPGFLPFDIFVQIARLVALPIIEFVPLRLNARGQTEVLLIEREDYWPWGLHTPGTVVRATDVGGKVYQAFERVKAELQGTSISDPHYVGSNLHKSHRGAEQAQIFWVEVLGEPTIGEFHLVDTLPPRTMDSQVRFIKQAAKSFLQAKSAIIE